MDLGLADRVVILSNGGEALSFFESFFECLKNNDSKRNTTSNHYQPISLLMLDINMPIMTGMEVCKAVKQFYSKHNATADVDKKVLRPVICYLSQYNRVEM